MEDNQWSVHTLMEELVPTTHPRCCISKSLPIRILFQPCEDDFEGLTDKNSSFLQYFPRSTRARRHDGFFKILQLSFASRASLKMVMSLKPKPSSFFGLAIFFQEIQDIFLISGEASHQNLVKIDWIWVQRLWGSLKHDMAWTGIAASTGINVSYNQISNGCNVTIRASTKKKQLVFFTKSLRY